MILNFIADEMVFRNSRPFISLIKDFYGEKKWTDVTIQYRGGSVTCHKFILGTASPILHNYLAKSNTDCDIETLVLDESFSHSEVEQFLSYLYGVSHKIPQSFLYLFSVSTLVQVKPQLDDIKFEPVEPPDDELYYDHDDHYDYENDDEFGNLVSKSELNSEEPCQPILNEYAPIAYGKNTRDFLPLWYRKYPWLEFNVEEKCAACYSCRRYSGIKWTFTKWKQTERLKTHSDSNQHKISYRKWMLDKHGPDYNDLGNSNGADDIDHTIFSPQVGIKVDESNENKLKLEMLEENESEFSLHESDPNGPCQPILAKYAPMEYGKYTRDFIPAWYKKYPWLEFDVETKCAACYSCRRFSDTKWTFNKWKQTERLKFHSETHQHRMSYIKWMLEKHGPDYDFSDVCDKENYECDTMKDKVIKTENGKKKYECRFCEKLVNQLPRHVIQIHPDKWEEYNRTRKVMCKKPKVKKDEDEGSGCHVCSKCGEEFPNRRLLTAHEYKHKKCEHVCDVENCREVFLSRNEFADHMLYIHQRVIRRKKKIKIGEIDGEQKKHLCPHCGKEFPRKDSLQEHVIYNHSDTAPPQFTCNVCGKQFKTNSKLNNHILSHEPPTKKCPFCDKLFATDHMRKKHIKRMHVDDSQKLYQCSFCSKGFEFITDFQSHMSDHKNIRPYNCHLCDKSFKNTLDRQQHVRKSHSIPSVNGQFVEPEPAGEVAQPQPHHGHIGNIWSR